ncbi:MAG: type II toxin-antitoxin system HicA family toxin [Chlamydiales bacterium]
MSVNFSPFSSSEPSVPPHEPSVPPQNPRCLWKSVDNRCPATCREPSILGQAIQPLLPPTYIPNANIRNLVFLEIDRLATAIIHYKKSSQDATKLANCLYATAASASVCLHILYNLSEKTDDTPFRVEQSWGDGSPTLVYTNLGFSSLSKLSSEISMLPTSKERIIQTHWEQLKKLIDEITIALQSRTSSHFNIKLDHIHLRDRSAITGNGIWMRGLEHLTNETKIINTLFKKALLQVRDADLKSSEHLLNVSQHIRAKSFPSMSSRDVLNAIFSIIRWLEPFKALLIQNCQHCHHEQANLFPILSIDNVIGLQKKYFGKPAHLNAQQMRMVDVFFEMHLQRLKYIISHFIAAYAKKREDEVLPINDKHLQNFIVHLESFNEKFAQLKELHPRTYVGSTIAPDGKTQPIIDFKDTIEIVLNLKLMNHAHPYFTDAVTTLCLDTKQSLEEIETHFIVGLMEQLSDLSRGLKTMYRQQTSTPSLFSDKINTLTNALKQILVATTAFLHLFEGDLPILSKDIEKLLIPPPRKPPRPKKSTPIQAKEEPQPEKAVEAPLTSSSTESTSEVLSAPQIEQPPVEMASEEPLTVEEYQKVAEQFDQVAQEIKQLKTSENKTESEIFRRIKSIKYRKLVEILNSLGWTLIKGKRGKHLCFEHEKLTRRLPVPHHDGEIPGGTANDIIWHATHAPPKQNKPTSSTSVTHPKKSGKAKSRKNRFR